MRDGLAFLGGGQQRLLAPLVLAGAFLAASAAAVTTATPAGPTYLVTALAAYAAVAAGVLCSAPAHHPFRRFGAANAATLTRAVLACLAAGFVFAPEGLTGAPGTNWLPVALAVPAVLLDGADGWLARRQGLASRFGRRFDVEVDATSVLAFAGAAVAGGFAPLLCLALPVPHYLFRACGLVFPGLAEPLPPSGRRRLIGGLQMVALAIVLAPPVPRSVAAAVIVGMLLLLVLSFTVDIGNLLRHRRASRG